MSSRLFDLSGKVALITGSSKGIGLASAHAMVEHGANVVISSRKADACAAAATTLNEKFSVRGEVAIPMACNIGRKEELRHLIDTTIARWGRIDIVMANAAIHPWTGSVLDLPDETFTKFMQVNLQSAIWLAQMTIPGMLERSYGRIIVVSSIVGILGDPVTGTYGLTKAGDMQFVRNLATEFASRGICANSIAPGTIKTDMARSQTDNPQLVQWYRDRNPSQRFGEADEVAGLALLLASPAGGYINGQTIAVDGGHTISFR